MCKMMFYRSLMVYLNSIEVAYSIYSSGDTLKYPYINGLI